MGFKTGSYAKVFQVDKKSETNTVLRIATSKKNRQTGEYEQDFSGFVSCIGASAAPKAARINVGDRIKLGDIEVTTKYDKENKITYTNYRMFSFDLADETNKDPVANAVHKAEETDEADLPF